MAQDDAARAASRDQLSHLLFSGMSPEDLSAISDATRRDLLLSAADMVETRPPGRPKIRIRPMSVTSGAYTVVEILNDDMPFLVDSVMGEVNMRGLSVRLVLHPIFKVRRRDDGALDKIIGAGDRNWADGRQESLIIIVLDRIASDTAEKLAAAIEAMLADVRVAVRDWQSMLARFDRQIQALEQNPPPIAPGLLAESVAFCRWLRDGQFTFLGCRDYRLVDKGEVADQMPVNDTGLGVLRDPAVHVLDREGDASGMTAEMRKLLFTPQPLIIAKSNILSRIHRRTTMDYVGVKTFDKTGALVGELRVVGLFTSQAYTQPPGSIPFLRHKVEHVLAESGYAAGSHASKALANILEHFPRDELFQMGEGRLLEWTRGILDLELRPRVRLFVRRDRFDRYISALVYIQRDRFSTSVRERITALLCETYDGTLTSFTPFFPDGPLVRVHFIIACRRGDGPEVDVAELERRITEISRTWDDQLAAAITASGRSHPELAPKYGNAFSAGYAETFSAARAVEDIKRIERLTPERPVAIDFYRAPEDPPARVRAAIYRFDKPIPLSDRVPVLENLGFSVIDERTYRVHPRFADEAREVVLHDMMLEMADGQPLDLTRIDTRMEEAYLAVYRGEADNDPFNRLVVLAGMDWREAAMMRAYAAYMRQIRSPFGMRYIAETVNRHAGVARDLVELFHLRFDPDRRIDPEARGKLEDAVRQRIDGALSGVQSLDEDRILRSYLNLISVTVRANFYQRDGEGRHAPVLAFKLDSKQVDGSPEPRPFREIWVYSPRVEGIHLRFAAIARGGIRWSDRAQDFRTEVLGLCKAQNVKNTVIVPAGAKGGFLPKQMPRTASRDDIMNEGIATYRLFISALLSITDNLKDGNVVPPADCVRHDGDDPYLVVAADKGTATFSDFANALAIERGFWLGDAFASGGSAGYDHKKMGITARGAWESVKRHFGEMDVDIQKTPFRVTGVGDMSGDVFGNGMLLSPVIRLVAAFDHRDIFIDPSPDVVQSFAERKRLFDLPRSSWQDYDKAKLSRGGGIFSRSAKSIPLNDEIRQLLGVKAEAMTPAELMNAILKCETDLLWFGGIGTYIRASGETDDQAGDRANDAIRVTGAEVRAKVIGEGANLGVTQRGRIEFASRGGRINTDFIDNSAGVNSSDQEVNIKIAIGPAVASGRLPAGERNPFLASMTDDVAGACLVNNVQQALAISLAERRASSDAGFYIRLMDDLEARGLLSRTLEALPGDPELRARAAAGQGLTRPEIAVLLSFAKIALDHDLLATKVPDNPACQPFLAGYFPPALRTRFAADIPAHPLRREIIATFIVNAMINRGGPAFVVRLGDETGRNVGDIACAFLAARSFLDLSPAWATLHELGGKIGGQAQLELYARTQDALVEQTVGLLRSGPVEDIDAVATANRATLDDLLSDLGRLFTPRQNDQLRESEQLLVATGVPASLARRLAAFELTGSVPQITRLARDTGRPAVVVGRVVNAAAEHLRIGELKARAKGLKFADYYDRLAVNGALNTLDAAAFGLARDVLKGAGGDADFDTWAKANSQRLAQAKSGLDEIAGAGDITVSRLTVAASRVRELAGG